MQSFTVSFSEVTGLPPRTRELSMPGRAGPGTTNSRLVFPIYLVMSLYVVRNIFQIDISHAVPMKYHSPYRLETTIAKSPHKNILIIKLNYCQNLFYPYLLYCLSSPSRCIIKSEDDAIKSRKKGTINK